MPFKIKDGLQVGTTVSLTSTGIVTDGAFNVSSSGFLKRTGVNTWAIDTNTYVTSSGVTSVSLSLPTELTVSGSPVTGIGTLTAGWASQVQKKFFCAPNAADGTPTFRVIAVSDVPTLNQSTTGQSGSVANSLTINSGGSGTASPATFNGSAAITISYNTVGAAPLSHTHGNITNAGAIGSTSGLVVETTTSGVLTTKAAGTTSQFLRGDNTWNTAVTSIAASTTPVSGLSLSGGTITSTGTIGITGTLTVTASNFASQTAKYALAAPTGADGVPTFRQLSWTDIASIPSVFAPTNHEIANAITLGANHTISGATAGGVLRASSATAANFQRLVWSDVDSKPTTFAPTSHVIATNTALGSEHTISGATAGGVLRASSATAANFQRLVWSDVDSKPTTISGYGITDAYTKIEVDGLVTGLDFKQSVRVATTVVPGNITLSGTQTIDSVAVVAGDRVLVKDQTIDSQNGLYTVAAGAWSRTTDADNSPAGEVTAGMYCFVEEGSINADSGWVLTTNDDIILGTTALEFVQFNGLGQVTAGTGLVKNGNTIGVANSLTINSGGSGTASPATFNGSAAITISYNTVGAAPLSHTHGNITNAGAIGSTSGLVVETTTSGVLTTKAAGTTSQFLRGDNTWNTAVTSVGLSLPTELTISNSPVTTSGTLTAVWASQVQKKFFCAPNAADGTPTFRVIAVSDVPTLNQSTTGQSGSVANSLTINSGGSGTASPATFNGSAAITISYNTVGAAPLSHTHGNITNAGAIGSTSGLVVETTTSGVLTTKAAGTTSQFLRGDNTWVVPPDTTYTAGNGLGLAGGAFSLDTPSTLTTITTNLVTADSHTHAITTASTNTASTIIARDSSGDFAANIITAEGVNLDATVHNKYATATVSVNTETPIDTWAGATYRTCKYLVQVTQATGKYYSSEILVIHDGTITTSMTEYGIVELEGATVPVTFTSDYSGGNVRLKATVTNAATTSAVFKISKTLIVV